MARPLRLRKHHLLPDEAVEVAKLLKQNQPLEKEELDDLVEDDESLESVDIEKNFQLLKMSNNLVIENGKARIKPVMCEKSKTHVLEKFQNWERKSRKTDCN